MKPSLVIAGAALLAMWMFVAPSSGTHVPPAFTVFFDIRSDAPEGVLVYRASNAAGLATHYDMTFSITSFNHAPLHVATVNASGGIHVRSLNYDGSGGFVADGDDALYLGTGDTNLNAPPRRSVDRVQLLEGSRDFASTEGWIVFVWKDQGGPWEFRSVWPAGTTFELVATGTVDTYSHKSLQHGARAGLPPALVAWDDGVTLDTTGGQTFGWVTYRRSDYVGLGELAVTHEGTRHVLDLTQYPTPEDRCYCGEEGRWMFTSHQPVEVEYDAVQFRGDGGLYVVAMHLPAGTLPDAVWQERILWPRDQPLP